MIIQILILLAVIIVAVIAFASTKPNTFRVERTTNIKASPDKISPFITNLHNWAMWSPYEKLDLEMKKTYSGADMGKGAIYEYDGNSKVGAGRMEILDVQPNKIIIQLDFIRPMKTRNTAEFLLDASSDSMNVTWAMNGPMNLMSKVMCMFVSMDSLVGKDFETGLQNLKSLAEKQ